VSNKNIKKNKLTKNIDIDIKSEVDIDDSQGITTNDHHQIPKINKENEKHNDPEEERFIPNINNYSSKISKNAPYRTNRNISVL